MAILKRRSKSQYSTFWIFKYKINIIGKPPADGNTKDVQVALPLKCVISSATRKISSNQDNAKLLEQLRSGFKRANNWNKC